MVIINSEVRIERPPEAVFDASAIPEANLSGTRTFG
jgi:hypothetical protein